MKILDTFDAHITFLSADSFSSALLVRLEEDGEDDFFQKFGKERKNLLTDLFRRSI